MPCVLPVISLKLFSLIKSKNHSHKEILHHNLSYACGIYATFLALAIFTIILKLSGEEVGWGIHLQSPIFVGTIIIFVFIFALNLFGHFEFKTPGGKYLSQQKIEKSTLGHFLEGVFATILSTPCSAPFLGTALSFAFTSSPIIIIIAFLTIGLGLSFPFLITGFYPKLIKFLPSPGNWMEQLKKFLGLSLLFVIVWLNDVFTTLTSGSATIFLYSSLILIFFALYWEHQKVPRWSKNLFYVFFITSYFSFLSALKESKEVPPIVWETFSKEKLLEYKKSQDLVFIDFTAKWCFTCKVNERLVLNTKRFQKIANKYKVKTVLADWTKRDPHISKWLKKRNIFGVPVYFIQDRKGNLINLGETISFEEIESHLKKLN